MSIDDLAFTMGIRWWTYEITEIPEGEWLYMVFVDHEGPVEFYPFPGQLKVGDHVKLVLSDVEGPNITCSLVTPTQQYRASRLNQFYSFDGPLMNGRYSGPGVALGEILLKKSEGNNGTTTTSAPIIKGEIGITVRFFKDPSLLGSYKEGYLERYHQAIARKLVHGERKK